MSVAADSSPKPLPPRLPLPARGLARAEKRDPFLPAGHRPAPTMARRERHRREAVAVTGGGENTNDNTYFICCCFAPSSAEERRLPQASSRLAPTKNGEGGKWTRGRKAERPTTLFGALICKFFAFLDGEGRDRDGCRKLLLTVGGRSLAHFSLFLFSLFADALNIT